MSKNTFQNGLARYLSDAQLSILANTRIGIAGAGGLGSNVAMLLARSGMEKICVIDYDVVEASNLNRQLYWPRHLGQKKVMALASILQELNPAMDIRAYDCYLTKQNLPEILKNASIWVEALDGAENKKIFVEAALDKSDLVVSASGICGIGGKDMRRRRLGKLFIAGDFVTGLEKAPPLAPRVTQAAALMADAILEFLLSK